MRLTWCFRRGQVVSGSFQGVSGGFKRPSRVLDELSGAFLKVSEFHTPQKQGASGMLQMVSEAF